MKNVFVAIVQEAEGIVIGGNTRANFPAIFVWQRIDPMNRVFAKRRTFTQRRISSQEERV